MTTIGGIELNEKMIALSIPILAIGGGLFLAFISIIVNAIHNLAQTRHLEQSRREIAAYVAEGTMSPDDATKLIEAGSKKKRKSCG
jgi:uncharacterized membrane protein